ncbi:Ger(x)C family spore germination protein [Clostridium sp. DL1XJH146]
MKKMKKALLSIFLCQFIFTSCFSYKDINNALYCTCITVDIAEDNNPVVYIETFKPLGGEGSEAQSGTRIVFKGKGKTMFEAIRNITLSASFRINFTQNKVIIFTRKAADYGLENFIDLLDRDQELILRPYICITEDSAETLLTTEYKENKYLGIFIVKLLTNVGNSSRAVELTFNRYMIERLMGSKVVVVPLVEIKKESVGENKIEIIGGAVLKEDKLVSTIKTMGGQGYSFMMDKVKSGTLEPNNPSHRDKYLTLEILNNKTKTDINVDEDKIILIKNIKVETTIGEIQEEMEVDKNTISEIQEQTEENIIKACYDIFEEYKEKNIDLFNIKEELHRKYPKEKFEDVISSTELVVNVDVKIRFSNDTLDFY